MATISTFSSPPWPNSNPNPNSNSNPNPNFVSQEEQSMPLDSQNDSAISFRSIEYQSIGSHGLGHERDDDHDSDQSPNPNIYKPFPAPYDPPTLEPHRHGRNENPNPNIPKPLDPPTLLHLSFNQDQGCFAVGTDYGFRIFNCDPFREIFRRDFDDGGISGVEMLFRCNILALVGGGPHPQYPPSKVMIWDDHQGRCIGELSFRSDVRSVRLRRDRIVVVLEQKVYVYNFADLKLLHQIETISNPKGLCAVSQLAASLVLVCPGLQKGQVRVEHYASKRTKFIMAHDSRIACFALTPDGQLLATASSKGTLVRVFNSIDGTLLQEVRRGADRAEIYSLAFSSTAQWLAVSSDKGTVHVFNLKVNPGSPGIEKSRYASDSNLAVTHPSSSLSFIKAHYSSFPVIIACCGEIDRLAGWQLSRPATFERSLAMPKSSGSKLPLALAGVLPKYFSSEWSVAQFRLPEGSHCIVAFGHQKNTVVILGMDGSFYRCQFDPAIGGEMTQVAYHNFLKPEETF